MSKRTRNLDPLPGLLSDDYEVLLDHSTFTEALKTTIGAIKASITTTSETETFDNSDLTNGAFTITHTKGTPFVEVTIWDDNNKTLQSMNYIVSAINSSSVHVQLAQGIITGTWRYFVKPS